MSLAPIRSSLGNIRWFATVALLITAFHQSAIDVAAQTKIKVVTDRTDAIYQEGETARFIVSVTEGDKKVTDGKVQYVVDDFIGNTSGEISFPKGELNLSDKDNSVSATSSTPQFLRCVVTYVPAEGKPVKATAAAAFSPLKITPSLPVPADFDEFWAEQKRKLAKVAMDPQLVAVKSPNETLDCFDVKVACLGGAPVSGYFSKPRDAKPKSLPAILWVHGAGVRSSSLSNAIKGASEGMLSMDMNAHGIPNGKPGDFYSDLSRGKLRDYRAAGREDRETSYFKGMFLRLVRGIDFLTSQPEWDGENVIVIGHSQGGGQALAAGGLDQRVTVIAAGVPAICDHSGRAAGRINGWPKLVPLDEEAQPNPQILEASRYVDAVNFASRCKADAIMSVGFIDGVCPPSSCYAAFNSLKGSKKLINEPLMSHAAPPHIQTAFFDFVKKQKRLK